MIREIEHASALLPLFRRLPYALVPVAVSGGIANGTFYAVDGEKGGPNPTVAVLWDAAHGLYIAGDVDQYRGELIEFLGTGIVPVARPPGFILYSDPAIGDDVIESLLPNRKVLRDTRVLFRLVASADPAPDPTWQSSLVPVTDDFFRRTDLSGRDTLDQWLAECWKSLDDFAERGFGVAALNGSEVVGWCGAEYVGSAETGIGIETAPSYRGRGLGTALARSFVAIATERGLSASWDSWARNRPSLAIAKRLGYVERTEYQVHWVVL